MRLYSPHCNEINRLFISKELQNNKGSCVAFVQDMTTTHNLQNACYCTKGVPDCTNVTTLVDTNSHKV